MFRPITASQALPVAGLLAALLVVPLFVSNQFVLNLFVLAMLFSIFASSWNLVTGFAGLKTFGHHAFFGIGAYTSALTALHTGLSPFLTMWLGGLMATVAGFVVGASVLRIRSVPHVAIITLAFAEITRITASNLPDLTRGELGLWGYAGFGSFDWPLVGAFTFGPADRVPHYYLILALLVFSLTVIVALMRSRLGLSLLAIRDSQTAAASLGVRTTRAKLTAFMVSAFLVGVAGAFYAHYLVVLTPLSVMGLDLMIFILAMLLVGGLGTISGPVLGAFVVVFGIESLRVVGDYRVLIYGLLIMLAVRFFPEGLAEGVRMSLSKVFPRRAGDEKPAQSRVD